MNRKKKRVYLKNNNNIYINEPKFLNSRVDVCVCEHYKSPFHLESSLLKIPLQMWCHLQTVAPQSPWRETNYKIKKSYF